MTSEHIQLMIAITAVVGAALWLANLCLQIWATSRLLKLESEKTRFEHVRRQDTARAELLEVSGELYGRVLRAILGGTCRCPELERSWLGVYEQSVRVLTVINKFEHTLDPEDYRELASCCQDLGKIASDWQNSLTEVIPHNKSLQLAIPNLLEAMKKVCGNTPSV